MIQRSFMKFGIFEECVAVDEMIVRYYGHNSLKQFVRGKSVRFGYTFWSLCGVSGYCYNFDLYCRKSCSDDIHADLLLGSKVVCKCCTLWIIHNLTLFFSTIILTGYELLVHLRNISFQATGIQ